MLEEVFVEYRREKNETAGKGIWICKFFSRKGLVWSHRHKQDERPSYDVLGTVLAKFKLDHNVEIVRITLERRVPNATTDSPAK